MMLAKSDPVMSVKIPKSRPMRTAANATSSCQGLRRTR